jgi:hypothetical protein
VSLRRKASSQLVPQRITVARCCQPFTPLIAMAGGMKLFKRTKQRGRYWDHTLITRAEMPNQSTGLTTASSAA